MIHVTCVLAKELRDRLGVSDTGLFLAAWQVGWVIIGILYFVMERI